ncbi:MAG TPA: hypothetical protein VEZ13_00870 [Brevibacillus sp.]|nr:hypothetical protein [Brevibacillus sp.]
MPIKKKSTKRSPESEKIILLKRQASYYEEIALQYSHELKELQQHRQQWEEREKEYQQQIKEIRHSLTKYQELEADWRDKLANGTQQIRDLETKLQQQSKMLNQKESTIAHYKEKVEKLNQSDALAKARQYELALEEKQKIIEDYQEKEREWETQLEQAKLIRKQEIARHEAVAAQKIQLLEQELAEAVASHTAAQAALSKQLEERDAVISKLQQEETTRQEAVVAEKIQLLEQELAEAVASHTAAQAALSKQLEEKDAMISKLQQEETNRQEAIVAEKIQLLKQELEEAVASHTAAQEALSKQLEEKDSLISKLQLQESTLMKTIESLKNMHAEWQEKEKKYKESIQEFTAKETRSPKTGIPIQQTVHSSAKSIPATSIQMPTQTHATYLKPHQTPHTHPINPFKPTE